MLRFRAKDYEHTIGVDEAGRGPLAGPVVAAACSFLGDPESVMDIEEIRAYGLTEGGSGGDDDDSRRLAESTHHQSQ